MDEFLEDHLRHRIKELEAKRDEAKDRQEAIVRYAKETDDLRLESYRLLYGRYKNLEVAVSEALGALKETEEALSWLCGALRDQATGHPETLAMWNSTETVRRIEQARAVLKKQSDGATYSVGAMTGMAWRDIAVSAYRAYAASTGNKNYQGLPMPEWGNLTPAIQTAWEAAARQVGECTKITGDAVPPDEQCWVGWIPPHMKGK